MDRDAPEAFEMVDLRDRHTWHRATMREWIEMREQLVARRENNAELREIWKLYFRARKKAVKQMWREEGLSRKKKKPRIEGRYRRRVDAILKETFYSKHKIPEGFTPWEMEFLQRTKWIDELIDQYYAGLFRNSTIGLLFEWLITVEDEYNVAADRQRQRDANVDFVSGIAGARQAHGENPYLPRPLELIGIYRAALIVVEEVRRGFKRAIGNRELEVGSVEAQALVDEWLETRSGGHCSTIRYFCRQLRIHGYSIYPGVEDLLEWKEWRDVLTRSRALSARKLLAKMFKVSADTIKKDTSRSTLEPEYERFGIAEEWRDYLDGSSHLRTTVIRERGWYATVGDADPNLNSRGTVWFAPRPEH